VSYGLERPAGSSTRRRAGQIAGPHPHADDVGPHDLAGAWQDDRPRGPRGARGRRRRGERQRHCASEEGEDQCHQRRGAEQRT
jgi:hypothetical protein